jgi:hypothetical protein
VPQGNVGFVLSSSLQFSFFLVLGGEGSLDKVVEIDRELLQLSKVYLRQAAHDCVILCWVERESGRPFLHLWLNAPLRHCSPSLGRVRDLIAYCILALFMTESTFIATCAEYESENEYVYV